MATGEDSKSLTGPNRSSSSSSENDCDEANWMHPNNWEITSHSKPSKKQRNKEKSFSQEANTPNASERFSTNLSFQNYPRSKCNTASWLKDKTKKKTRESENITASWLMDVSDERAHKKICDSEEVFSDTDMPHDSMNFPVSHTVEVPEHTEDSLRSPSRSIEENIKLIKEDCKMTEEVRDELNKIKEAIKQVTQGEIEHKYLLQQMISEGGFVSNVISSSKASNCKANVSTRDSIEGSIELSDEEHISPCNHLLDRIKQCEERLMCVQQQEDSLLGRKIKRKKKPETKLPSFQDSNEENSPESVRIPLEQLPADQDHSSSSWYFNSKSIGEQLPSVDKSILGTHSEKENHSCKVKDEKDIKKLQMSLEHIKRQVQLLQQTTDINNITRSPSPENFEFEERVARVEFERKKLKNKILELQEKKKMNTKLLHELTYLRDTVAGVNVENEASFVPEVTSQRVQLKGKDKHKNIRSGSHMKRDNVRNDINSDFPARRHYEAEGRANEDPDIPTAPPKNTLIGRKSRRNTGSEIEKLRKFKEVHANIKKRMLIFNDLITSIQEHNETGKPLSKDHQRLLASLNNENDNELCVDIASSDSEECDPISIIPERNQPENTTTVKKICSEEGNSSLQSTDIHEEMNASPAVPYNMELPSLEKDYAFLQNEVNRLVLLEEEKELISNKKKDFTTLKQQINKLIQRTIEGRNVDIVRSSGEGGYVHNRNADSLATFSENRRSVPPVQFGHQDNLLTRQNIATMESQNQGPSRNLHKKSCGSKKDNINNLTGKMGKISIQNTVNGRFSQDIEGSKENLDSISVVSSELNQSHCGETERKTILDILKRNRKKQKVYDINRDNQVFSNSSIDSEILENTQAANTTAAATWGGSSTHEMFQDENDEPTRHFRAQQDVGGIHPTRENSYCPTSRTKRTSRMFQGSMPAATSVPTNELPRTTAHTDSTQDYQQQMSIFILQVQKHIDQLNALCQERLNDVLQTSMNFHPNNNQNLFQTGNPFQSVPENIQPYNQQLLLCLSQCYHNLYLQQLEIQHLHRCLRQNIDAEVIHQASNSNPQENNDEFVFRPWCLPVSNPFMPSETFSNEQASPNSSACYKPFPSYNTPPPGIRPVQAVIHPANHGNTHARETLNNQVPPHTRANNFLDNFRSYSRQNMLSTSNNNKRNENIGLPVPPQIRQVHPLVSNEDMLPGPNCRTHSSTLQTDFDRSFINSERPRLNTGLQDLVNPSKKPNADSSLAKRRYPGTHKKGTFINTHSSEGRDIRSQLEGEPASTPLVNSSTNLVQLCLIQDDPKIGNFSSVFPTSSTELVVATSDAPSHPSELDYNSDFLHTLYQEAKALKSHAKQQQALERIRDLALSENGDSELTTSNKKSHPLPSSEIISSGYPIADNSSEDFKTSTTDMTDREKSTSLSESSIPQMEQNLPTAAISALNKEAAPRSTSTGAVRKKPKIRSSCFWDGSSNTQTYPNLQEGEIAWDNLDVSSLQPVRESTHDFTENAVENILLDLQTALPFGQMREDSSMSFWCSINAYIINRIRAHMNVPLPHKSLALLRHRLDQMAHRFIGKRVCESEFLNYISQFLYESIACFMATGRFTSSPSVSSVSNSSLNPKPNEKAENLNVKISEDNEKTNELSFYIPSDVVFFSQYQPVLQERFPTSSFETEIDPNVSNHLSSEAEVLSEWGTEAETEPEVEVGTEADLAEADQSPSQGTISSSSMSIIELGATASNFGVVHEEVVSGSTDESAELVCGANFPPDGCADSQEIALDDVPTKLYSIEEEPEKLEEEPVNLSVLDNSNNSEVVSESNNCESEVTSTK